MTVINVNGRRLAAEMDGDTPLLWALREQFGLTGTKFGCGAGLCGACTVHLDGKVARSCVVPVSAIGKSKVRTIEALGGNARGAPQAHALQQAWIEEQVPQCGYCQSGMLMAAAALLAAKPKPSDADIDQAMSNLCRCGTYNRVRRAIKRAAGMEPGSAA
ncbi:(2Fe-2S)-binding protein [Rugamonas sp. DEMB1]|uniref:(2Fe-2S)-binding protein n=1 Tax=Rugamonas sp. DEMB1 TaxID=3039386 RepID=UPI0024499E1F|nr:(2Fe-2S)-binding protein [Rugamonas sp. DEMB1]WGG53358.1 (2Fe-2S)-binding protein [Rugamonas sp. DEMB1]